MFHFFETLLWTVIQKSCKFHMKTMLKSLPETAEIKNYRNMNNRD